MMEAPPIEDSFQKLEKYPTVVQRYYSKYLFTPEKIPEEAHCVLMHSNRICLITLAETHPVVREKKQINNIDFKVSDKLDRTNNKVVGKGKKGAQFIMPNSSLCFIECSDGTRYTVLGCIKGKLIEINQNLVENNKLLVEKPLSHGFVAIVLPNLKEIEEQKSKLKLCRPALAQNDLDFEND